jgi:hypothetical protein
VESLQKAIGRALENRGWLMAQQHQAARSTFLVSGMVNENFKAVLTAISPRGAARVAQIAAMGADVRTKVDEAAPQLT